MIFIGNCFGKVDGRVGEFLQHAVARLAFDGTVDPVDHGLYFIRWPKMKYDVAIENESQFVLKMNVVKSMMGNMNRVTLFSNRKTLVLPRDCFGHQLNYAFGNREIESPRDRHEIKQASPVRKFSATG